MSEIGELPGVAARSLFPRLNAEPQDSLYLNDEPVGLNCVPMAAFHERHHVVWPPDVANLEEDCPRLTLGPRGDKLGDAPSIVVKGATVVRGSVKRVADAEREPPSKKARANELPDDDVRRIAGADLRSERRDHFVQGLGCTFVVCCAVSVLEGDPCDASFRLGKGDAC